MLLSMNIKYRNIYMELVLIVVTAILFRFLRLGLFLFAAVALF